MMRRKLLKGRFVCPLSSKAGFFSESDELDPFSFFIDSSAEPVVG